MSGDRDTSLDRKMSRNLAIAYQTITSNPYLQGDAGQGTYNQVAAELAKVKTRVNGELELYGISPKSSIGICHTALIIEELLGPLDGDGPKVTVDEMIGYMDYMHYKIDPIFLQHRNSLEIAWFLLLLNHRRLENYREHNFVLQIFFSPWYNRQMIFPGIFYQKKIPSALDIQANGVGYYYPRAGELTLKTVQSRFDYREMYHIIMTIGSFRTGRFPRRHQNPEGIKIKPSSFTTERSMAAALITAVRQLELDPRMYITLEGIQTGFVQEPNEDSMSINDDMPLNDEKVREACSKEGILFSDPDTERLVPLDILFENYTTAQLTPAFSSHPGEHRSYIEASSRATLIDGTEITDVEEKDIVLFGMRDGFTKMMPYTIRSLYETFEDLEDFYDPISVARYPDNALFWTRFPKRAIRRLVETVLPSYSTPEARKLITVCRRLLRSNKKGDDFCDTIQKLMLKELRSCDESLVKRAINGLYYLGAHMIEYFDEIEAIDPRMVVRMMLKRPNEMYLDPTYTGRVRAKCQQLILFATNRIDELGEYATFFERLVIVKSFQGELHYMCDDLNYTIGQYLDVMLVMAKFNLRKSLVIAGKWLIDTATVYRKLLYNVTYGDLKFEFDDTTPAFELMAYGRIKQLSDPDEDTGDPELTE